MLFGEGRSEMGGLFLDVIRRGEVKYEMLFPLRGIQAPQEPLILS